MAFQSGAEFGSNVKAAYAALMAATKAAGRLPSDLSFHRTLDETLDAQLARTSATALRLANALWTPVHTPPARNLASIDDVAMQQPQQADGWTAAPGFSRVVDGIDTLLERIDVGLDEVLRRPAHGQRQQTVASAPVKMADARGVRVVHHGKNVARPQLAFDDAVDNSAAPFAWRIREKPHALVPLEHVAAAGGAAPEGPMGAHLASLGVGYELPHPYAHEIANQPVARQLYEERAALEPLAWDATPFAFVDQPEALARMMEHLQGAGEVAVDLEHHSYRSYQGFTCLVQVSSRTHDFVVDALALRSHLHVLNAVTADPAVVKVLHGAESDVVWLQRDFGVYLVGLFDTYHASHVLNMAHHSLAHLLRTYCGFEADKKHQLADWRIRPLPQEMLDYARSDTHFLLYVYDCMRNELVARGRRLVGRDVGTPGGACFGQLSLGGEQTVVQAAQDGVDAVVRRSRQTALRRYAKEAYDADHGGGANGWAAVLRKWRQHSLDAAGLAVFRALHRWRDACAREEDESPAYVMPTHMLFAVAERCPRDVAGLMAACRPNAPPLVRLHAVDVVRMVVAAEEGARRRVAEFDALVGDAHREAVGEEKGGKAHIRFGQQQQQPAEDEDEDEGARADVLTAEVLAGARALVAPVSGLFGEVRGAQRVSEAGRRAREIRRTLVLTVAVPVHVQDAAAAAEPEFVQAASSAGRRPEASVPRPAAQPVVLSEVQGTKRRRPHAAAQAVPAMPRMQTDELPGLAEISLHGAEDSDSDHGSHRAGGSGSGGISGQARKKAKRGGAKNKKNKGAAKQARVDVADVTPHVYAEPGDPEALPALPEVQGRRKPARQQQQQQQRRTFDPYAQIETSKELAKRPARSRVHNKQGNKTITFRK